MGEAITSMKRWEAVDAPLTNAPGARSPELLRAVVAQFDVVGNPRYQPEPGGATFCNILASDVTRALGCELPHWIQDHTVPAGRRELNVNGLVDWLDHVGHEAGWMDVVELTAAARAAAGYPTVAVWKNPKGGHGHIAVLLPPRAGLIHIAQAGRKCLFDVPLRDGFGSVQPLRFFTHA